MAAERATEADIADVRKAYDGMSACFEARDHPEFMEANYLFHMAIYRAAHMPRLMRLIEPHWLRISPFLWSLIEDRHLHLSMDRHMDALRSIEARNASGLEDAVSADIPEAKRGLLQLLASR
jgi:DNA-binding GntR family transcriptional regulator